MKKSALHHAKKTQKATQKTRKTKGVKDVLTKSEKKTTLSFSWRFFFYAAAILMAIGVIHALVECIIIDQNPANSAPGWVAFLLYLPIYAFFALLLCGVGVVFKISRKKFPINNNKETKQSKVGTKNMTYGEKIYTLRESNGMSQEELAERLEVSRQTISNWENDKVKIDIIKAKQLCDIFHIGIEAFCADELSINKTENQPNKTPETEKAAQNPTNTASISATETNAKEENAQRIKNSKIWKTLPWLLLGCFVVFLVIAIVDTIKTGTLKIGSMIELKSSWWMMALIALVVCAVLFYQNKKKK